MNESPNKHEIEETLKKYLLGNLTDKDEMTRIEEKLLLDDDFNEQISIAEDELVDQYLDGSLSETERLQFHQFFLISPDREEKLRFIRDLRKYAGSADMRQFKESAKERKPFFNWRGLFAQPAFRFAALALVVCGLAFAVWRVAIYESQVDKGLAELQLAYRGQRPTESRTTANLGYARLTTVRGTEPSQVSDDTARDLAQGYLLAAAKDKRDAEAQHAAGLFYLTQRDFDKALVNFNLALALDDDNAKLHSDTGAAYLEKAELLAGSEKEDEFAKNADKALHHLNRALELNPNLPEALFNKALLLEKTLNPSQAAETWKKYLEKDSTSGWATEAKEKLRQLELKKSQYLDADELQQAFLDAFKQNNEAEAQRLIGQNREVITESYLPQKLAMSVTAAPNGEERNKYLQALIYAGKLEKKHNEDNFTAALGDFYAKVSATNLGLLKNAHDLTREGYYLCRKGHQVKEAMEKFTLAREIFLQAGNVWEAKLSEFLIIYCLKNRSKITDSLPMIEEIVGFCQQRDYKWLLSSVLVWYAGAQRAAGQRAKAKISYRDSLDLAGKIKDSFMIQSTSMELAKQKNFVGQNREALRFLLAAFKSGDTAGASLRQRWRNYSDGAELLAKIKHYNLAKAASLENIRLAEDLENKVLLFYSQLDVGIAYARAGDSDEEARKWLTLAKKNAELIENETDRKEILAKSLLELGHLERKNGNFRQADKLYSEALTHVEKEETPYYNYEIRKSRLLSAMSLGNDDEVEKQIAELLVMAEKYREQISEEQERNSFFDNEQTIYDVAVAHNFKLGKREQAYNHLEKSNSRSLLDWLKKGVEIKAEQRNLEIVFNEGTEPLPLEEIRARMPERVQILQYTVLDNKVLIWVISKDKFEVVPSQIDYEELNKKVAEYVQKISVLNDENQAAAKALGRELYDLLIAPALSHIDPTREICLIPHKILFHLPFAALTAPDEKPFLKQFNFFYAPSANVFLLFTDIARQKPASENESLLGVGNPRFDKEEFKTLRDLRDAEDEVNSIASLYPGALPKLIGTEATKAALQNSLPNAEVIHFAGHYIVKHGEPLYSGLLLTKSRTGNKDYDAESGILTNADLIRQPLPKIKLVVLPACQTGVEQYYNGEGLVGLSRTFLAAGAPLVVASQWQVDSGATAKLMKKFHYFRKQQKLSTTAALRRAQLEMLDDPDERFRQPYFWAAFAAYGGYAEF